MSILIRTLLMSSLLLASTSLFAEIPGYESTDNSGLNKKERIDAVETYLTNLTKSLAKLEQKLDENSKKIAELNRVVLVLKENEVKKVDSKLGEAKKPVPADPTETPGPSELEKLKTDVMTIKNQDIQKLKETLGELGETVKAIQEAMKK